MAGFWSCVCVGGTLEKEKTVVTLLQRDGTVLELQQRILCSKLLTSHPDHMVCLAKVMLGKEPGKMLPKTTYLERGEIYALVPRCTRARIAFRIPKEYRALICGEEGASKLTKLCKPAVPALAALKRGGGSRVHAHNWSAPLDSISETDD
eukprot:TRINITY_DN536_c0_g1_i1.p2 TRINITY_DN536_c0_g1~~TRINITY_DN536_c0_g1_i1.p2  ORF type:complete len:150 (+),score=9.66 TRINITY_DN536_c0_g1_i1:307-756(+)